MPLTLPHLYPCRTCGAPAVITYHPVVGAPYCIAECSALLDCPEWDMTRWNFNEADAAQAWNEGRTISCEMRVSDAARSQRSPSDPGGIEDQNGTLTGTFSAESQVAAPHPNRTPHQHVSQEKSASTAAHEGTAQSRTESARESDAADDADAQGNAEGQALLSTQAGGVHKYAAGQLPPMPVMSAEDSIATYSDDALMNAAASLRKNERTGWPNSWESRRMLALLREIRRRGLNKMFMEEPDT